MLERLGQFITLALSFVLGVILLILIFMWSNPAAFWHTAGEIHDSLANAFGALGIGIVILFCVGVGLGTYSLFIRINQSRKVQVITPTKYGMPPAVVIHEQAGPRVEHLATGQMDPMQLLTAFKQSMQMNVTSANALRRMSDYVNVVDAAGEQTPEMQQQTQKQLIAGLHIPTFAESMRAGLIGPGQEKVLICYELERDEDTGLLTGNMTPYVDELENNCTMFLGGASKSGKSTLMAHLSAQEAIMNALFYVIDPHLKHPERSIAAKIAPLAHAFILPPAMTDGEVKAVLAHAEVEALARQEGRETPYSGRPIVFIVDEVLSLFARAQKNPDDKEIQALYRDLTVFMRALGTEYNKFALNGIFASQYVTKDAFKLPGNVNVDFRDGCQNQTLLRLPANQAQAMRLLDRAELRGVRQLGPGHGYMGFYDGSIIRMAAGNVDPADMQMAGSMVKAAPGNKTQFAVGGIESGQPEAQKSPQFYAFQTEKLPRFQPTSQSQTEDAREVAQEAGGSNGSENSTITDLSVVKGLREIGKRLKEGETATEIVKSFGLSYGRATQELKATVEFVEQQLKQTGEL
jgi:hypothetical protein